MSIFGNILGKIFHHDKAQAQTPAKPATPAPQPSAAAPHPAATPTRPHLRRPLPQSLRPQSTLARCWKRWPR